MEILLTGAAGFEETDRVREPASLHAATKLSAELLYESYARLYDIPQMAYGFSPFTDHGAGQIWPIGFYPKKYW